MERAGVDTQVPRLRHPKPKPRESPQRRCSPLEPRATEPSPHRGGAGRRTRTGRPKSEASKCQLKHLPQGFMRSSVKTELLMRTEAPNPNRFYLLCVTPHRESVPDENSTESKICELKGKQHTYKHSPPGESYQPEDAVGGRGRGLSTWPPGRCLFWLL